MTPLSFALIGCPKGGKVTRMTCEMCRECDFEPKFVALIENHRKELEKKEARKRRERKTRGKKKQIPNDRLKRPAKN